MRIGLGVAFTGIAAVLGGSAAAPALAGPYVVTGCAGQSATAAGWAALHSGTGAAATLPDDCAHTGGFSASLTGPATAAGGAASAAWRFVAPDGTALTALSIQRTTSLADGGATGLYAYRTSAVRAGQVAETIDECLGATACAALGPSTTWSSATGAEGVQVGVLCPASGIGDCGASGQATVKITAFSLTLTDQFPPQVDAPTGALFASAGVDAAPQTFTVHATDRGGGLVDVGLEVDGTVRQRWPVTAACAAPYVKAAPCPLDATTTVAFDAGTLSPGSHTARVLGRDVSGAEGASPAITLVRAAPPPAPGTPASPTTPARPGTAPTAPAVDVPSGPSGTGGGPASPVRRRALLTMGVLRHGKALRSIVVPHGRTVVVAGRLQSTAHRPITRATVVVQGRLLARGVTSPLENLKTARTDSRGRFRVRLAPGPSRAVRVVYGNGAAVATVRVRVHAGVTLIAPRRAARGVDVVMHGAVDGGVRKLVALQALLQGRWQTFATTTTADDGTYSYAYRFVRPGPRARHALRAFVPEEAGFPYLAAASKVRSIEVR